MFAVFYLIYLFFTLLCQNVLGFEDRNITINAGLKIYQAKTNLDYIRSSFMPRLEKVLDLSSQLCETDRENFYNFEYCKMLSDNAEFLYNLGINLWFNFRQLRDITTPNEKISFFIPNMILCIQTLNKAKIIPTEFKQDVDEELVYLSKVASIMRHDKKLGKEYSRTLLGYIEDRMIKLFSTFDSIRYIVKYVVSENIPKIQEDFDDMGDYDVPENFFKDKKTTLKCVCCCMRGISKLLTLFSDKMFISLDFQDNEINIASEEIFHKNLSEISNQYSSLLSLDIDELRYTGAIKYKNKYKISFIQYEKERINSYYSPEHYSCLFHILRTPSALGNKFFNQIISTNDSIQKTYFSLFSKILFECSKYTSKIKRFVIID